MTSGKLESGVLSEELVISWGPQSRRGRNGSLWVPHTQETRAQGNNSLNKCLIFQERKKDLPQPVHIKIAPRVPLPGDSSS